MNMVRKKIGKRNAKPKIKCVGEKMNKVEKRLKILNEYKLICQGKSELSSKDRGRVVAAIERVVTENIVFEEWDDEFISMLK